MDYKKAIEIPLGAKDSELYKFEYTIPDGYEAEIKDGKVIVQKKESEDERIRKAIGAAICGTTAISILEANGTNLPDALSYLEKQKDQDVKVISWREPDDCADIPEGHYVVIAYKPGVFGLGYIGNGKVVCAPGQKPSGILYIPNADESIIVESKEQKPAEWSEEDEWKRNELLKYLEEKGDYRSTWYSWLKSLRHQPHWKPSDEQIDTLEAVVGMIHPTDTRYDAVFGLLEELKAL